MVDAPKDGRPIIVLRAKKHYGEMNYSSLLLRWYSHDDGGYWAEPTSWEFEGLEYGEQYSSDNDFPFIGWMPAPEATAGLCLTGSQVKSKMEREAAYRANVKTQMKEKTATD